MDLSERDWNHEHRHPWETARFHFFSGVFAKYADNRSQRILDVGSGDAWFASQLLNQMRAASQIYCWDQCYADPKLLAQVQLHKPDGIKLVSEAPKSFFDWIFLLDVLEHVDSDLEFLKQIVTENMSQTSHLLISVPAWPKLFTSHDTRLGHFRRYTPQSISKLLQSENLVILQQGGLFSSLIIPRMFSALKEKLLGASKNGGVGSWNGSPLFTQTIVNALDIENSFLHQVQKGLHVQLPGLSWWGICKRKS